MEGLSCPNCGGDEIRIEVPAYSAYRPVRIEELNGRRYVIAEHYDLSESDGPGEFYCIDCGENHTTEALGVEDWQDTERWDRQRARAATVPA